MADRLILLNNDGEKEINIFIHGYTQSNKTLNQLMSEVNSLELRGSVYLLYWDSGKLHIPQPVVTAISVAGHVKKVVSITNPVSFGTVVASDVLLHGVIQIKDYLNMRSKAEQLGTYFLRRLSQVPNAKKYPINLIGYSLGARVIHYALANNNFSDYNLQDVILLAGATTSAPEEWYSYNDDLRGPVDEVNGHIYNIYSKNDDILRLNWLVDGDCAGRNPIPTGYDGTVVNKKCDLGHLDYFPNLEWLFHQKFPDRETSRFYRGVMDIECPFCEQALWGTPYKDIQCPACTVDFEYRHSEKQYYYEIEPIAVECPCCEKHMFPVQESADYTCPECQETISFTRKKNRCEWDEYCEGCDGTGNIDDDEVISKCADCKGAGTVTYYEEL